MASDMREAIMAAGRSMAQAHGYNGLSFRELAKKVGIRSASIHYHFPTKGDLGAALAKRYSEDAKANLATLELEFPDAKECLREYAQNFRQTLEKENRMCLCGFMAAEYDSLPESVRAEVVAFSEINVAWLTRILGKLTPTEDEETRSVRALAIFGAIGGAQLLARSRNDISVFDRIVGSYRATGLIPS